MCVSKKGDEGLPQAYLVRRNVVDVDQRSRPMHALQEVPS